MVLPSVTELGLDSTPAATSRASTRVVLPAPDGPTRAMLRTSPGPFAMGAAPPLWAAFAFSAMTSSSSSESLGPFRVVCPSSQDLAATFPPTAAQYKATRRPLSGRRVFGDRASGQACQSAQRPTAIAITGPSSGTD